MAAARTNHTAMAQAGQPLRARSFCSRKDGKSGIIARLLHPGRLPPAAITGRGVQPPSRAHRGTDGTLTVEIFGGAFPFRCPDLPQTFPPASHGIRSRPAVQGRRQCFGCRSGRHSTRFRLPGPENDPKLPAGPGPKTASSFLRRRPESCPSSFPTFETRRSRVSGPSCARGSIRVMGLRMKRCEDEGAPETRGTSLPLRPGNSTPAAPSPAASIVQRIPPAGADSLVASRLASPSICHVPAPGLGSIGQCLPPERPHRFFR